MGFVCLNQGVCAFTYLLSLVCLSVCVPCVRVCRLCIDLETFLLFQSQPADKNRNELPCQHKLFCQHTHTHSLPSIGTHPLEVIGFKIRKSQQIDYQGH